MPLDHVVRDPVLLILLCASLASWIMIIERLLVMRASQRADRRFLAGDDAPSAPLAILRHEATQRSGAGREHMATILDAAIATQRQRLDGTLPLLGVIGSTAPYLGLLGTVIGIIQAFQAIQSANTMSPSIVSGGIASALIATAAGLAVAIPAVTAHHLLAAVIARRVTAWERTVATWLPDPAHEEEHHESVARV